MFEHSGKLIIGYETLNPIELEIGKKLIESGLTLSIAESLTGGLISSRLTSFSGSSKFFKGSIVSYSTFSKQNILGVNSESIKKYSVVSSQISNEMSLGVKKLLKSDYSISTTGNAGPTKGESNKNIGKIFISLATPNNVKSFEFDFGTNREKNINKTVNKALELLFNELSNYN